MCECVCKYAIIIVDRIPNELGTKSLVAQNNKEGLELLVAAIEKAGYTGKIKIGMDCAASEVCVCVWFISNVIP